jgi:pentatricopeptide repeat protein
MHRDFGVAAKPEHYTCMIDLLGRAGRLDEAQGLMKDMPFEPDGTMWGALLGASRIHRNPELGRTAAEKIFELEPENGGMYVLLSNIYASSGKWRDVGKMRVMMEERGVKRCLDSAGWKCRTKYTLSQLVTVCTLRRKRYMLS